MDDEQAMVLTAVTAALLIVVFGLGVYLMRRQIAKRAQQAASLAPEQARAQYAPEMPGKPLLYSVLVDRKRIIKDQSGAEVASITYPIAKDTIFRLITIGSAVYECHLERNFVQDQGHLYEPGADPKQATPRLTFAAKIMNETYTHNGIERYRRNLLDRQPGKGWPIYADNKPVAYLESLHKQLKTGAFLLHPTQDIPLVEQIFIIAMSEQLAQAR